MPPFRHSDGAYQLATGRRRLRGRFVLMSAPNDGGSAFPFSDAEIDTSGMTLRDWFAGQALAGLVFHNDFGMRSDDEIANGAYSYADAMIARGAK
jgi:hypothetical protein